MSAEIISQLDNCKVIANGGVGVDRVDLDAATEHGIVVTNVPGRLHRRSRQSTP